MWLRLSFFLKRKLQFMMERSFYTTVAASAAVPVTGDSRSTGTAVDLAAFLSTMISFKHCPFACLSKQETHVVDLYIIDVALDAVVPVGLAKLMQRPGLNLPYSFPRHRESSSNLLQSLRLAVVETEPHPNYRLLSRVEGAD
mmetsp:Transcript_2470/g.7220  ORF Transcript_2470/g.7220 Transcript_2470/m.7220 type:complete len:142 (-) Transcript_2470:1682-2107(-)